MKKLVLMVLCLLCLARVEAAQVQTVAESTYQWTGIAVAKGNRTFVCYPTWRNYPSFKVAEIIEGRAVAFPDKDSAEAFNCVQSVFVDANNRLWILDTGKARGSHTRANAKLFLVDLEKNKIVEEYVFPENVDYRDSYLNDVRVDTKRNMLYLTDSGKGGIIVVDWQRKRSWRALTAIPQVQASLEVIDFVSTGFDNHQTHSDGIELAPDGKTLYFTPMTGKTIYSIATRYLQKESLTVEERAKQLRTLTNNAVATDGLLLQDNRLYMGDLAKEGLYVFDLKAAKGKAISLATPIRWADSFAAAPDGTIYFTTSEINYRGMPPEAYKIYRLIP